MVQCGPTKSAPRPVLPMWRTCFVIGDKEIRSDNPFPPFTVGGEILLYLQDLFDKSQVPKRFKITQVIYDLYSEPSMQYIYLTEQET